MKTRIISMILVVVMLALALVGCGYDFTSEDMSENAEFKDGMTAEAFGKLLYALEVEDPSFGNVNDSDKRNKNVADAIYALLLKEVETTTSTSKIPKNKLTDGELDLNDWVYYSFYATYEKPGANDGDPAVTTIIYPSKMSTAAALALQLGYSDETLTGADVKIRDAILAAMTDNKLNFSDYAYKTTDSVTGIYEYVDKDEKDGTNDQKVWVYVDYTTEIDGDKKNYTNVKMLLDLNNVNTLGFLAQQLLATKVDDNGTAEDTSDDKTVSKYQINSKITDKLVEVIVVDNVDVPVPTKPTAPVEPTKPEDESDTFAMNAYNAALAQYNTDKAQYDIDLKAYEEAVSKNAKNDITYTDITVKYAVESNIDKYITAEYTTEDEIKDIDTEHGKVTIAKDTKITYYVYPVNYAAVPNLDAEIILKELIDTKTLTKDTLDCLNNAETELKAFTDALTAYNTAKDTLETNKTTYETKQSTYKTTLDNAIKNLKNAEGANKDQIDEFAKLITKDEIKNSDDLIQGIKDALAAAKKADDESKQAEIDAYNAALAAFEKAIVENDLVKDAAGAVVTAKTAVATAEKALNGDPNGADDKAKNGAIKTYEAARDALFAKVGDDANADTTDDAVKGQEKIVKDYEKSTYDSLAAEYEAALRTNIGKAIWKLMKDKVKITELPEKAVDEIYERMYEEKEYEFYTGYYDGKSANGTNYKHYANAGGFKQYLIEETIGAGKGDFEDAKEHLRGEAEDYVEEIVILYFVADALGQKVTEDEVDDYKKDTEYETYVESYGEINMLASFQAEKLFDYLLEVEMETKDDVEQPKLDEETGARNYLHIKVTTFTEKTESE